MRMDFWNPRSFCPIKSKREIDLNVTKWKIDFSFLLLSGVNRCYLNVFLLLVHRYPVKYGQNSMSSSTKLQSGNYYTKDKTEDFKVFHTIPASSHLLANYDPFYSPLLSRIDTVYKQLGYTTEPCRERLVCQMYKNPAKFAPYSNLISAQLSRSVFSFFFIFRNRQIFQKWLGVCLFKNSVY